MIQKLLNYIKTKWSDRTNPQAALSVFDKSLKKLDKIDKRIVKQQDKCSTNVYNINAQCDLAVERCTLTELKARSDKRTALSTRDKLVSKEWDKSQCLDLKLSSSEKLRSKLNELNSI